MQARTLLTAHPTGSAADFTRWHTVIAQGNHAFQTGDYKDAARYYQAACTIAEALFACTDEADSSVAMLVIAHHNLADTYEHLCQPAEQCSQLCRVHEKLSQAMDDQQLDENWRWAAFNHSRRTYAELTRFTQHHPEYARARTALAMGARGPISKLLTQ